MRATGLAAALLLVAFAPAVVRADKTIEVKYTDDGNMVVTESDGSPASAPSGLAIKNVEIAELPRLVRERAGRATLLVLYTSSCKHCRELLPRLTKLARKVRGRGLTILAFSLDEDEGALRDYLKRVPGTLERLRLLPGEKGQLAKEARGLGLSVVGDTVALPVYAVFDARRKLVREGTGAPAQQWLDKTAIWALQGARMR